MRRTKGARPSYLTIPTPLGAAIPHVTPARLKRLEARLGKALDRLQSDGTLAGWEYVAEDTAFLERQVCVRTPQAILDHYA